MMPYPPSLRSRAASSMEPAIGASTWALGSQRCMPYSGAFTMNAVNKAKPDKRWVHEVVSAGWFSLSIVRCRVPICVCK